MKISLSLKKFIHWNLKCVRNCSASAGERHETIYYASMEQPQKLLSRWKLFTRKKAFFTCNWIPQAFVWTSLDQNPWRIVEPKHKLIVRWQIIEPSSVYETMTKKIQVWKLWNSERLKNLKLRHLKIIQSNIFGRLEIFYCGFFREHRWTMINERGDILRMAIRNKK